MKKFLFTLTLALLLTNSLSAHAAQKFDDRGCISVNTSAETEIQPDVADISFSVITSDSNSLQKATAKNKEISEKVYTTLKELISADDYIKTVNYNATPIYKYSSNKKTFDRYEVTNTITVHTKSIDKVGQLIDKATAAGANNVESLSFSVSDFEKECNVLIDTATKKAKSRANAAAKALSTTVEGFRSINVNCSKDSHYPQVYRAAKVFNSADSVAESSTPIEAGKIKIQANVNACFYVK